MKTLDGSHAYSNDYVRDLTLKYEQLKEENERIINSYNDREKIIDELRAENRDLKLKLTGRLQNKNGNYDPILIPLWYLKKLESGYVEQKESEEYDG